MQFNEYIESILPELKWRHFGVGALQAYLHEGGGIEQRLHIWDPSLVKPGIVGFGDCHDHRFSFTSQVLCGCVENVIWTVTHCAQEDATHDVYEVENARAAHARTGSHDGTCRVVDYCFFERKERRVAHAGSWYEFPRGAFHQTRTHGLTVTLVTKYDQRDDVRARILCPKGEPLVHAFGDTEPPIAAIVWRAQEELRAATSRAA